MTCFTSNAKTISLVLQRTQEPRHNDRAPGLPTGGSLQRLHVCARVLTKDTAEPAWGGNLPISDDTRGIKKKKQHTHQQEAKWVTVSHSQQCKVSLLFVASASGDGF